VPKFLSRNCTISLKCVDRGKKVEDRSMKTLRASRRVLYLFPCIYVTYNFLLRRTVSAEVCVGTRPLYDLLSYTHTHTHTYRNMYRVFLFPVIHTPFLALVSPENERRLHVLIDLQYAYHFSTYEYDLKFLIHTTR